MSKKLPGALSTGVWDTTEQGPTWDEQREKSTTFFQACGLTR